MATRISLAQSAVIDPLDNPYWSTRGSKGGMSVESLGNGDGTGVFDWTALDALGYDTQALRTTGGDGDASPVAPSPQVFADFLKDNGLTLREEPGGPEEIIRYVTDADGNLVGEPQSFSTQDDNFWTGAMLAAAVTGANIAGAASAGGAAASETAALGSNQFGALTSQAGTASTAGSGALTQAGQFAMPELGTVATNLGTVPTNWAAIGVNAAKSAGLNAGTTLARGGSLSDAAKSAVIGGVTGGVGGYASQGLGLSAPVTGAVTGATGAALRGGDLKDVAIAGGIGALSGYAKSEGITGNKTLDNAIVSGGSTALRGGDAKDVLISGAQGALNTRADTRTNTTSSGGSSMSGYSIDDFPADPGDDSDPGYKITDFPADPGDGSQDIGDYAKEALKWLTKSLFGTTSTNGTTTGGLANNSAYLQTALGLIGAGVNQASIERAAKENREYASAQDAAKRRRQMPVTQVNPTGALVAARTPTARVFRAGGA